MCTDRTRPVRTHFPSICFVGGVSIVKFSYPAIQYTNDHQTKKIHATSWVGVAELIGLCVDRFKSKIFFINPI